MIFDNGTAACAEDGVYSKRDELLDYLGTHSGQPVFNFEISCFKYWLDDENDRNIILISSPQRMDAVYKTQV